MKLAFILFKYFPFGGLQRDFLRIAGACRDRGHSVRVFTMQWEGAVPEGFEVEVLPGKGFGNHQRCANFSQKVQTILEKEAFDAVIGFNKLQGLDVYFAADTCFEAKAREERSWLYRLGGRYRTYARLERAVFDAGAGTQILMLTETEIGKFIRYYQTPAERFHLLPPGIDKRPFDFADPGQVRQQVREQLGLADDDYLLLMVGSGFKTKGLDRSLQALAGLPEALRQKAVLAVIGKGEQAPFLKLAERLGISGKLRFLGTREDVPKFMRGADLLLHPSYSEAAGMVLLEAMLAGLPVLCTASCGYAFHIAKAEAGLLIPEPFSQAEMNSMLQRMLNSREKEVWSRNGLAYTRSEDLSSLPEKALEIIERAWGQIN